MIIISSFVSVKIVAVTAEKKLQQSVRDPGLLHRAHSCSCDNNNVISHSPNVLQTFGNPQLVETWLQNDEDDQMRSDRVGFVMFIGIKGYFKFPDLTCISISGCVEGTVTMSQ